MRGNYQAVLFDAELLSQPNDADKRFEDAGGHMTNCYYFGRDHLEGRPDLMAEDEGVLYKCFPQFGPVFHSLVKGVS